jgi:hypothetical protein
MLLCTDALRAECCYLKRASKAQMALDEQIRMCAGAMMQVFAWNTVDALHKKGERRT